jgi:hypothetical protein
VAQDDGNAEELQPVRKIRREVFDLLGPAARATAKPAAPALDETQRLERGLALRGQTEMLPLACRLSPEFVGQREVTNMLANRTVLVGLVRDIRSLKPEAILHRLNKLTPLPGQVYSLALARQALNRLAGDVYLDRPNVLSYHMTARTNAQGEVLACQGFDIVANDVAVRPGAVVGPFEARVAQGLVDTNAEALLMTGCGRVENTGEIFSASNPKADWATIRSTKDPAWGQVDLPKDVRARIDQDLAAGYLVIVPRKPISVNERAHVCWWRIDPRTGETLGIGSRGWGAAIPEYLITIARSVLVAGGGFYLCLEAATSGKFSRVHVWSKTVLVCAFASAIAGDVVYGTLGTGSVMNLIKALVGTLLGELQTGVWLNPRIPDE